MKGFQTVDLCCNTLNISNSQCQLFQCTITFTQCTCLVLLISQVIFFYNRKIFIYLWASHPIQHINANTMYKHDDDHHLHFEAGDPLSLSDHPHHRHLNLHQHCVGAWAFMAPPTCVCTFTWLISTEQSSSPSNLASHHISSQVPTTESAITTYRLSNMEQTWLTDWWSECLGFCVGCFMVVQIHIQWTVDCLLVADTCWRFAWFGVITKLINATTKCIILNLIEAAQLVHIFLKGTYHANNYVHQCRRAYSKWRRFKYGICSKLVKFLWRKLSPFVVHNITLRKSVYWIYITKVFKVRSLAKL